MPRNGSGVASQPPNTRGGPANTTISSAKYNSVIDDIYQLFNTPMPIAFGGTNAATIEAAWASLTIVAYGVQTLTAAQQAQARANISAPLNGHLWGLTLSNNAIDATNDIDIAVGDAASTETDPVLMTLATGITKRLDAAWAVGSGNGGLDTGSIANTTYHVWLIQRSDTGVVDALFSTSATAPTMPTNYDRKRRIGSIIRSGAAILAFRQFGNRFMLSTTVQARSSTAAFADALLTVTAPAGIRTRPILNSILSTASSTSVQNSIGDGDASAVQYIFHIMTNQVGTAVTVENVYTNTSSQIRYLVQINSGTIVQNTLNSVGWWDDRGITA